MTAVRSDRAPPDSGIRPTALVTTRELAAHAKDGDLIKFIKEYRRVNPGLSMEEAKGDYRRWRAILER